MTAAAGGAVVRFPVPPVGPDDRDRATAYAKDVVAGAYVVGRLVRLAAERHLRDLETAQDRGLQWRPRASERVIDFFRHVQHFEGPKAGEPVVLEPWQCFAIGVPFGWYRWSEDRQRWVRRFRKVFHEVAKKNGKSLVAGGLGVLLAFFDGERGAKVYAAATKRDQAKLVWDAGRQMVLASPPLRSRIKVRALSLFDPATASKFVPLGKETKTEDGINPNGVLIDEIHRHEDDSLINLLTNSTGARDNPMVVMITTAGPTGINVWAQEHDYAVSVLEGLTEDDSLFAYVANLDEGDDPFDEANWPKANPNLGVSVFRDELRDRAREAIAKPGALNDFLRLRLNVRTQSAQRWMPPELWRGAKVDGATRGENERPPGPWGGRLAYGGLDLGEKSDLSALVMLAYAEDVDPETGEVRDWWLDVFARFWCPLDGVAERSRKDRVPYQRWVDDGLLIATPGNVTDFDLIRSDLNAIVNPEDREADYLNLYEVGYDPFQATQLVTQLTGDGWRMARTAQSFLELNPAVDEVERLLALGKLRHGGHPILAWMVDNTVMVQDAGQRRRPDKTKARDRIDGVPALLMALKRWMAYAGQEREWTAA